MIGRLVLVPACCLVALAQAFIAPQPRSNGGSVTVVRNVMASPWTMMPDEPAPEVRVVVVVC